MSSADPSAQILALLQAQCAAFQAALPVPAEVRRQRLQRVIDLLVKHCDALCAAMEADFGGRPVLFSMMNDVLGSLGALKAARDHFEAWMPDQPRVSVAPFDQFGATAFVKFQPKGVVGVEKVAKAGFNESDPNTWGTPARNDPCPCGSGEKFKHCHGKLA